MVNKVNNKSCGFDEVMVSYIYDEMPKVERRGFETHLVDCSMCTEEFAEISSARFSVFEWQREAFADLPTPGIVISYPKSRKEQIGFIEGLRGLFTGFGIPVTAAASVVIALGIGFAAFTLTDVPNQIAADVSLDETRVPEVIAPDKTVASVTLPSTGKIDTDTNGRVIETIPIARQIKPVKAVLESKRSRPAKQLTAVNTDRFNRNPAQLKKAPALSNFNEADDRSLRLTDLFDDEIGSIR